MKRWRRSQTNRVFAGVCGGLAESFDADPDVVRALWILLGLWGGIGLVPYVAALVLLPESDLPPDFQPPDRSRRNLGLALIALANDYGRKDLVYSGPVFREHAIEGARVRLKFDHTGSGLAARDGKPLTWFEIAGADGKFVPAEAAIDGNDVVVGAAGVAEPKAVRFAWSQIAEPNLINREGLPAGAFRTR